MPGDDVTVLKRTGSGFLAAGANRPNGDRSTPVIFLSADGKGWTRLGGGQLRLAAGGGQAQDIRLAAASGNRLLIAGDVASGPGHGRTGAAWLSDDGRGPGRGRVDLTGRADLEGGHADGSRTGCSRHPGHHRADRLRPHADGSRLHRHPVRRAAHPLATPDRIAGRGFKIVRQFGPSEGPKLTNDRRFPRSLGVSGTR